MDVGLWARLKPSPTQKRIILRLPIEPNVSLPALQRGDLIIGIAIMQVATPGGNWMHSALPEVENLAQFPSEGGTQARNSIFGGRHHEKRPQYQYVIAQRGGPRTHGHVVVYLVTKGAVEILYFSHTAQDWQHRNRLGRASTICTMLARFIEHLESSGLILPGQRVLVGYSGGPDSTCLLHLLKQAQYDIVAAHLHHGQRQEAEKEMALCDAFCQELDVPFLGGRANVPAMVKEMKVSEEEAGRIARYEFLQSAARQTGCHLIATAHTKDDLVETVLLNLTRGTGLAGLAGIPARRENILRPLLIFTRSESVQYCEKHALWTHDDPANTDPKHSRSRIRLNVIPELREINPQLLESIARAGEIVKEEDEFLNGMAAAALERAEKRQNGELSFLTEDCELGLDRHLLLHLPTVLLKRGLRLATAALGGTLDHHNTVLAADAITAGRSGAVTSEQGVVALNWNEIQVHLERNEAPGPFRSNLATPGEITSDDFNWSISVVQASTPITKLDRASLDTFIDAGCVNGQLYFRNWKPNDKMQPLGFEGHRKVSDLLSDAKLTHAARSRLPLICDMIGPVWIPGVCLDERMKPDQESRNIWHLEFGPASRGPGHRNEGSVKSVLA